MKRPGLRQCFCHTFHACLTNLACAPFFLIAVLFYVFYYCWPYTAQLPEHLDAIVVDEDASPLSRRVIQSLMASPDYRIVQVTGNRPQAIAKMRANEVSCVIGLPPDFEKDILADVPTALTLVSNGAFIVKARISMTGASGVLEKLAAAAVAEEMAMRGAPVAELAKAKNPPLVTKFMYNTIAGYLSFAVAIVFVIIFQTIMICGFCMLLNDWFWQRQYPEPLALALESPPYLLALQAPVFCICVFRIFFVEGCGFAWQGINSFQNIPATILTALFFGWALTALGLFVGLLFKRSRFAIHAVVPSSLPCVFISGNLFAWQDIPAGLRAFAFFLPSTPGVDAMLRASQAGAAVTEIFPYLLHLLFLGLLYFGAAFWLTRRKSWRKRT